MREPCDSDLWKGCIGLLAAMVLVVGVIFYAGFVAGTNGG